MDCKYCRELIGRYLADALSEMEEREVQAHIQTCEDCAREEAELRRLIYDLSALDDEVRAPKSLMENVRAAILKEKQGEPKTAGSKKRKRELWKVAGIVAAALAVSVLSGTLLLGALSGGRSNDAAAQAAYDMAATSSGSGMTMDGGKEEYVVYESAAMAEPADAPMAAEPMEEEDAAMDDTGDEGGGEEYGLKIIRTAEIQTQSENFDEDMDSVIAMVQEMGGYITSQSLNGTALEPGQTGYGRHLSLTIRVPSELLDTFLDDSETVGVVQYANVYEEDVTYQYYDTARRLQGYETQHERILALMEMATTVEELISIESELNRINYEIESLTGDLRYWDSKVNYSTVYFYMDEVRRATPVSLTLWQRMQASLANTVDNIVVACQNFVVGLYGALPVIGLLLVVFGIAGVVIVVCVRKNKRKKSKE